MSTAPAQVTVPFAYSIMHRSHPVEKSKLEKEFIDEFLGSFVTLGHSWNHRRIRHDQTQRAPLLDACGCRLRGTRMSCRYWTISTINIYPFLSSGTKGVAMSNLTGPEMNFLNDQISALRSLKAICHWEGCGMLLHGVPMPSVMQQRCGWRLRHEA